MARLQITRRQVLKGGAAAGLLGAVGAPAVVLADGDDDGVKTIRWDIVNVVVPGCPTEEGLASARAVDGSVITMTGSGTFPAVRNRCSRRVTGGGEWVIIPGLAEAGCFSGDGTYRVTELLKWDPAPGTLPLGCDSIGRVEDARAGLAKLRVRYSNGETGVLTISCHLLGTPDCVLEGITASMNYEDFFDADPPTPGVEGNRTLFHVVRKRDDDDEDDD